MKIEADPLRMQPGATDPLGRAVPTQSGSQGSPGNTAAAGDQLQLSEAAKMVRAAIEAATSLPDVRQDLVDRMRALLNEGQVGADASRLADAIIERWLTTP